MDQEVNFAPGGRVLDRREPKEWDHVEKWQLRRLLAAGTISAPSPNVELTLEFPRQYREEYDQGSEGACVGYSQSWLMSTMNRRLYDAYRLYAAAQAIDEWDDTPPAGGTSLKAGFDVLRTVGHWRVWSGKTRAPMLDEGIAENRWALDVDEARAAIQAGIPLNLGINWYRQFSYPIDRARMGDKPDSRRRDYYVGPSDVQWGRVDGGHAITVVGQSDRRQAFALCNTWGFSYPLIVWLPYTAFTRLMNEHGECGIITDRVRA